MESTDERIRDRRGNGLTEKARELFSELRDRYLKKPLEPFEVIAEMGSPVVVDIFSTHLDGILAIAVLRELGFPTENMNYFDDVWGKEIPLPLYWEGGFWTASALWCPDGARGISYWRKRWDSAYERWVRKRKKINTGSGTFRSYNMPMTTLASERMCFYGYGSPSEVLRLLQKHITHIGKKRSQGYGYVRKWSVRPIKKDTSMVYEYPDGKMITMRALPLSWLEGHHYRIKTSPIMLGIYPPYWHPASQAMGILPFSEVTRNVD